MLQAPHIRDDSSLDCWRRLNGHVAAAEVIPREVQAKHRVMIASLLAVSVGQSRESAERHSGCEIEPFHAAGSDLVLRHIATDDSLGNRLLLTPVNSGRQLLSR